jgi:hypothetical protein
MADAYARSTRASPRRRRSAALSRPHNFRASGEIVRLSETEVNVIVLGAICLILGLIFGIGILWVIGLILVAVGIILAVLGMMDRAVGPRRHYW